MGKAYQPDLFKFRICEDNLIFAAVDLPDGAELIRKVNILMSFQFCLQAEKASHGDENVGLFGEKGPKLVGKNLLVNDQDAFLIAIAFRKGLEPLLFFQKVFQFCSVASRQAADIGDAVFFLQETGGGKAGTGNHQV